MSTTRLMYCVGLTTLRWEEDIVLSEGRRTERQESWSSFSDRSHSSTPARVTVF